MFASSSILTMKFVLMSFGVVSLAMAVKYTLIPLIVHFAVSDLPTVWSVFLLMFKPPYLYLILNGIIIIIAIISRFTQSQTELSSPQLIPSPIPVRVETSHEIVVPPPVVVEEFEMPQEVWNEKKVLVVNGLEVDGNIEVEEEEEEVEKEVVQSEVVEDMGREIEVILPVTEKPLLLTAFGAQKQSKLNPEGGSKVRVTKYKRQETLDSTWRMITEGRVKNWDAIENLENPNSVRQNSMLRKSATFKDRTNFRHEPAVSSGIVRKESSLGKEELNHRVEAFIQKFNEDMRLQRQESEQRYMEMINHG